MLLPTRSTVKLCLDSVTSGLFRLSLAALGAAAMTDTHEWAAKRAAAALLGDPLLASTNKCLAQSNKSPDGRGRLRSGSQGNSVLSQPDTTRFRDSAVIEPI